MKPIFYNMSTPPEKKQVKCGNCGELGHNKRTCPKNKPVSESSKEASETLLTLATAPATTSIYVITTSEWCNGRVDTDVLLCASVDAMFRKLKDKIEWYNENYADLHDSEQENDGREMYRNIVYYRNEEQFQEIAVPTKEQIETALHSKGYGSDVLINIGDLHYATSFALQISVGTQTLYS